MRLSQIISVVTVPDEHLPRALEATHQGIDGLVIEGVPVYEARVRVKKICDPKTLNQLMKKLSDQ